MIVWRTLSNAMTNEWIECGVLLMILAELDFSRPYKIGCADGAGFFYCGADPNFPKLNRMNRCAVQATIRTTQSRISNLPDLTYEEFVEAQAEAIQKGLAEIKKLKGRAPMPKEAAYVKSLYPTGKWDHTMANRKRAALRERWTATLERLQERLSNYVPVEDREIVEIYDSITEPDVGICIITGQDAGKFWTLEEAQKHGQA